MLENVFKHELLNKELQKNINFFINTSILFVLPVLIQNQLIVGPIVNAIIIRTGLKESKEKLLITSIVPSLGAVTSGLLFGALTPFVVVMIPFIWFSNLVLAVLTKKFFVERQQNYFKSTSIAIIMKVSILLTTTIILAQLAIIPKELLIVFGSTQLLTGFLGAIIAYFFVKQK